MVFVSLRDGFGGHQQHISTSNRLLIIDFRFLFCFLDENDGAECNERRRASQNRNAQRCFVYQATSFVFLPFGVEDCQSIHREAFCLILLFVFNPPYKSTLHSPRNNAISFKNKDRNGNWILFPCSTMHTPHCVSFSNTPNFVYDYKRRRFSRKKQRFQVPFPPFRVQIILPLRVFAPPNNLARRQHHFFVRREITQPLCLTIPQKNPTNRR